MLFIITVAAFLTVFSLAYLILTAFAPWQGEVAMRLKALDSVTEGRSDIDAELARPFAERVISPLTGDVANAIAKLAPRAIRKMVEEKITAAGGFGGLDTGGFLLLTALLAVTLPLLTLALGALVGAAVNRTVGLGLIVFALGAALPFFFLQRKVSARKASIQRDLPDVLDLLTVSVEAGLGFDGALAKLAEKMKGSLVEEFNRVLQEIRIGVPRRESLHALGERCGVPDLSLFTTALVQADHLGVSIGNVLRVQSAAMREKRRQRAQEQAMKAPVKMLLPLVIFIFPAIFVVLVGPAAIRIFTVIFR